MPKLGYIFAIAALLLSATPVNAQYSQSDIQQNNIDTAENESNRLLLWFEQKYQQQLARNPMQLTRSGSKLRYDELNDFSEQTLDDELLWLSNTVTELKQQFDPKLLNAEALISYELWLYQYTRAVDAKKFRRYEFIFNQMLGPHTSLPQFLISTHRVESAEDMDAYISRLQHLGRAITQYHQRAKLNVASGARAPGFAYEGAIKQSLAILTGAPFTTTGTSPLWQDALTKLDKLKAGRLIDEPTYNRYIEQVETALLSHVYPSYQSLISWMEKEHTLADKVNIGVSRLVNGADYYSYQLENHTTTNMTAEQVHQLGLDEVSRLTAEMEKTKQQIGFKGSLQEFFQFIRTDEQFFYPNTDEGRQAYLDDSSKYLNDIAAKLPDFFGILPTASLDVRRVEAFREQPGAPQHYSSGSPDGKIPGIYYAHLADMRAMPKPEMEAIAYHEGLPGHHMQISIAQKLANAPSFRKNARFTVYTEGWALYAEYLAKEMGAYQNLYSEFGRLMTEMWRAVRLVVDTGMHAKNWTDQDAIAYFRMHTPINNDAIVAEVQRYLVIPGQATAFKVGMNKIISLRQDSKTELGDKFNLADFHDVILGGGALPLHLLEQRIANWKKTLTTDSHTPTE